MKELKLEELSVRQKLGMVMTSTLRSMGTDGQPNGELEFTLELIKNHSLGAVWISPQINGRDELMAMVRKAADYPLLIMTDAESGLGDYKIGRHNAVGMTDSEELAYIFGKVTAMTARKMGYNVIGNPVLDMVNDCGTCGATIRGLGHDKHRVTALAAAEARGVHDGGVLTIAKHYPSGDNPLRIDPHMAESYSERTKEELLEYNLYPYLELMREGLIDGIMTSHQRFAKIDPDHPASLSKKVIDIIREQGFDGFAITDALGMMGIKASFGETHSKGLCIAAGNDISLPWDSAKKAYEDLCSCYDEGMISDERLDEAVGRVLAAQHKVFTAVPKFTELTAEDIGLFGRLNRDSVWARADDGIEVPISRDGKHFFVMLVENRTDIKDGKVEVDTFSGGWYYPTRITKRIEELFPNSAVMAIGQFPSPTQNHNVLHAQIEYNDVIFISFADGSAYVGSDALTQRIVALIEAMQMANRLSAVVHFGNPFVLEALPHIPRIIIGGVSVDSTFAALDVLAGKYPPKGVLTYDVELK